MAKKVEVVPAVKRKGPTLPKPPLGVMPKKLWEEKVQRDRQNDLRQAIKRYIDADRFIPSEWLDELAGIEADMRDSSTDEEDALDVDC